MRNSQLLANQVTRGSFRLAPLCLAIAVVVGGCGPGEDPIHDGKTLSEWIADAKGGDQLRRQKAYAALIHFGKTGPAVEVLSEAMRSNTLSGADRLVAARFYYRATNKTDEVVEAAKATIRRDADSQSGFRATKEAEELVFWLQGQASPMIEDLKYARDRIRAQDAAALQRRATIQAIISAIPAAPVGG
jgi:hypothetical protein